MAVTTVRDVDVGGPKDTIAPSEKRLLKKSWMKSKMMAKRWGVSE